VIKFKIEILIFIQKGVKLYSMTLNICSSDIFNTEKLQKLITKSLVKEYGITEIMRNHSISFTILVWY